ncbi:efflux RND transporter periplasmic adaptor subunit [Flavobacterium terrigena]|uniref:RND family efflux transporter, MFP subunit n=1 Tax=Flavobacterium terrigena TaxID=402734 RepID=A0A1H6Q9W5_9FLAO|nr:efflux RND transporter periplasmic adaptor subunit [Flavobacterium terrigena]SEI40578.1 RND family efflux transporter, MFP subunit [Flavobacterium terrigena]
MKRIIYLITVFFLFACQDKGQRIKPTLGPISESIYASGIVKSENQYEVYSPVNGIIDSIYVSEGDTINKGNIILSISSKVPRLNEENAKLTAAYSDIEANLGKLKEAKLLIDLSKNKMKNDSLMYFRQKNLWQQKIGSKAELEQKELSYQNSKTSYYSSIVRYNDLKRQLNFNASQSKKNLLISGKIADDYWLKSETNGIVYSLNKEKGEIVNTQTPLAVVGDAKNFILELQVDEYDIFKIHKGLSVKVTLDSYKGKVFEAILTKINPLMNERTRTFLVEANFLNPPHQLYPNISFEANIILETKNKALLLPRNYVLNDSIVFKSNGEKVIVKTGLKDYQKIEIISGITAQDELIPPTP